MQGQGQGQGKETGVCKWFNVQKGFGFITPSQGGDDLFVHQTAIHAQGFRSLEEGEHVEFDREMNPEKGKPKAVNVTGPSGDFVKGAQQQERQDYNSGYNNNSRGNSRGSSRGYDNNRSDDRGSGQGRQNWGQGQGQSSYGQGQGQSSYGQGQQQSYGNY